MKKILLCCFIVFFIVASLPACAQTKAPAEKPGEPQTKLEAFMAKKGKLIIKDSYDVDVIGEMGHIEMNALVLYEPGMENLKIKGIRVEVSDGGRLQTKRISFLDLDEIESAIKSIDYMMRLADQWKAQGREPYTEIFFVTKGFFKIGFYHSHLKQSIFIQSGYISEASAFFGTDKFAQLKAAFEKGLQILKSK